MTKQKIIQQGAEAIITKENNKIIKNRIKKSYRIKEIDEKLRKSRTKSEAKIMNKLSSIILVPKIIETDDKQEIIMDFIDGKKLSDNLEKLDYKRISKAIAENIAKMHNQGIVHGDLTTSNMIWIENDDDNESEATPNKPLSHNLDLNIINNKKLTAEKASKRSLRSSEIKASASEASACNQGKLYFIDFGLAFHSSKIEDKAVDLHLLQQALEAKHFTIWQDCWKIILDNYSSKDADEVKKRIKVIESRGRYKDKY